MRTIHVGRFGSARVWLNVVIEAAIPRGARTEYGLLGIRSVGGEEELVVELPTSTAGSEWRSPLVASREQASVGVRPEYADAILGAIEQAAAGRIGPGVLRVSHGACGVVGSSPNFMARLAKLIVEIMLADGPPETILEQLAPRFLLDTV